MTGGQADGRGLRLVVVGLAGHEYGVPIALVQEIIRHRAAQPIPGTPSYVEGVINLRGRIVPVVDLRARFGVGGERPAEPRIVIVSLPEAIVGVVVDDVREVMSLAADECAPPPPDTDDAGHVDCVGVRGDRLVLVLAVERVLGDRAPAA